MTQKMRRVGLLLTALVVFGMAGCHLVLQDHLPTVSGNDIVVPLKVLRGSNGAVLAFVPVEIEGQGPFAFTLDTGASNSLVDRDLVKKLGLPVVGQPSQVTGVGSTEKASQVHIGEWKLGEVPLPAWNVVSLELKIREQGSDAVGLIGSDVLSAFDVVTVDYDNERLILRNRQP
jgi:hypothetical protein